MKIAFVILAYKNPEQISALVKSLTHQDHYFFIHIDKTKDDIPFKQALEKNAGSNIIFVKRYTSYWGSYLCVKAMLEALGNALLHEMNFDYFIHLSGQDYPVNSVTGIREKLQTSSPSSFMYHFPLPCHWRNGGMDRLQSCSFFIGSKRIVLTEKTQNPVYKILYRQWRKKVDQFDLSHNYYGGEFYFILHRDAVHTLLNNIRADIKLAKRLKYTLIPEEIYIPTMLMQHSGSNLNIQNETLRYIPWEETGSSPKTIQSSDLPEIYKGNYLFARKFDFQQYPEVKNLIDQHIKSKTKHSNEFH